MRTSRPGEHKEGLRSLPPSRAELNQGFGKPLPQSLPTQGGLGYVAPMKFSQADPGDGYIIEGYEPGRILINGNFFGSGLILTPQRLLPAWGPELATDLTEAHIDALLELDPQVILLGTGAHQVFPAMALLARAMARGFGIEVMDTGAACRTYNLLMAEGRHVVAGLLPIRG